MCVYFRSHVHLHLDECPKRMIKCSVAGCNNYYQLGLEIVHNEQYQESHQALLKSQVERLQRAIYDKVCEVPNWPTVTKYEFNIVHK